MTIVWLIISAAIQIALCVHVVKSGRSKMWLWFILLAPILGSFVYFFKEWVPDFLDPGSARATTNKPYTPANPKREHASAKEGLDDIDTLDSRLRFAASAVGVGNYDEAIATYEQCLAEQGAADPTIRLKLATAHYQSGNIIETLNQIEILEAEHNGFKNEESQLIYAQSLAKLGRYDDALKSYEDFTPSSTGEEARVSHAMLLQSLGQSEKAHDFFATVIQNVEAGGTQYKKAQAKWYRIAKLNS